MLYPKAFETRRAGIGLMQEVELKEQEKSLVYLDSMLQAKQKDFDAIKGNTPLKKMPNTRISAITFILPK